MPYVTDSASIMWHQVLGRYRVSGRAAGKNGQWGRRAWRARGALTSDLGLRRHRAGLGGAPSGIAAGEARPAIGGPEQMRLWADDRVLGEGQRRRRSGRARLGLMIGFWARGSPSGGPGRRAWG